MIIDTIKADTFVNCPVNIDDINNSLKVFPYVEMESNGKFTSHHQGYAHSKAFNINNSNDIILYCDVMYIGKLSVLVTIDHLIGLTCTYNMIEGKQD